MGLNEPEYRVVTLPANRGYGISRKTPAADRVADALTGGWTSPPRLVHAGPLRFQEAMRIANQLNDELVKEE